MDARAHREALTDYTGFVEEDSVFSKWCPGEDSNLHGLRHWYLKPARLPIPPPGLGATDRGRGFALSMIVPDQSRRVTRWRTSPRPMDRATPGAAAGAVGQDRARRAWRR